MQGICYLFCKGHWYLIDVFYLEKLGSGVRKHKKVLWLRLAVFVDFFFNAYFALMSEGVEISTASSWTTQSMSVCISKIKSVCVYLILPGVLSFQQVSIILLSQSVQLL